MTCETHTHVDYNNIFRTIAIAAVALPLSLGLSGNLNANTELAKQNIVTSAAQDVIEEHKDALTKACIDFRLSKVDTKLERTAKNTIDEFFDGEVNYPATCAWILG